MRAQARLTRKRKWLWHKGVSFLLLFICVNVYADNWVGGTSADWFNAANWSAGVPNSGTDAIINSGGAFSPTLTTSGALAANIFIGQSTANTFSVNSGGGLHSANAYIGFNNTSSGTAISTGPNSNWLNDGVLVVGYNGTGTLDMSSGGIINSGSSSIASQAGSSGTATIDGANTALNNLNSFYIGENGSGTLIETGGAQVTSATGIIGFHNGSSGFALVDGAGTRWLNSGDITVSDENGSNGELDIDDGGLVSDMNGVVANNAGAIGIVSVDGAGSSWSNNNSITIGNAGTGTLTIADNAVVIVNGASTVTIGANSSLNIGALASNPAATAGTLSAASVQLNNNAIVVFNHTTSHYLFSAAINGTGSVSQLGSGTTVLSGTNSYSGGTTITAGTLQGTTNSLQGNIINNSHLVFDQTGTGVFSGTNSGSGDLTKNNLGTVIFNNANSYAGNTFINAGTLQIAAENNLGNGTEVIFGVDANNPAAIGTLAASTDFTLTRDVILNNNGGLAAVGNTVFTVNHISGTGGLTKSGTGTLLLNNPVTYTGNTIISQGTIKAGAANILATSPLLQINNGAQFDLGNISQSTNNLVNNGLITLSTPAPANTAYHTLNVAGAFSGNGTVALNTDLLNQTGDLINISGPTSGSQQILITNVVQSVDPASTSVVKLVQTQGGSGNFTGFTDAGTYRFAILPGNGSALTPDPNAFYLEYTSVLSNTANAAIGLYSSSVYLFYSDMQTLMQRMGEMRLQHGNGYWVRPYANHMIINNQASRSFDQSAGGFDMGVDKSFHKVAGGELNAGVFAGYLNAAQNFHQNNSGTVQGLSLGGYATWFHPEGWYVDAVAKYFQLWNNFHAQSSVGTSSTANYSVPSVGGSLEMGKRFNLLKRGQTFFVEPQLQFRTADIQGMNYAASNALLISGENQTSFQGRIGSQVGMHFELSHHRMVEPYLQASFIEELSGQNTVTTNAIAFNTKIPPSVGQFGAGASMQVSRRAYAYGEYDYAFGRGFHEPVALSAGVRVVW